MSDTAIRRLDAHDQAAAVRSGAASPDHFVLAAISAIRTQDPQYGAIAFERFDEAVEEARRIDRGAPFAGVPVLVKDLMCPVEGLPSSDGNRLLRDEVRVAARSSVLVERLRRAGFVVLGSTTTAEFGGTITTETSAFGACHNPRAPGHSSGGSSGGSAAAVAAGFVPIAHGNDASGSLRIPASFCGVMGFKPARGRIDDHEDPGTWFGLAVQGAIARTARDLRAAVGVLAGDESRAEAAPPSVRRGPRVGVLDVASLPDLDRDVAGSVWSSAASLAERGVPTTLVAPSQLPMLDPEFGLHFSIMAAAGIVAEVDRAQQTAKGNVLDSLDGPTGALVRLAQRRTAQDFAASHSWLMTFRARMQDWWARSGLDVLITPVTTTPAPLIGALVDPESGGRLVATIMCFTAQVNVTGQPAISVPISGTGLPVGVHLIGRSAQQESDLFNLAALLEDR